MGILRVALSDCYQYREVLSNILTRDLKVKYKRTFLGYFWSLLNTILQLSVMAVVFSHFVGRGMKDYTLYLFSGFLAWTFFQTSLILCSTTLLENENFIRKIYLPKILFPLSRLCLRALDFAFSLVALSVIGIMFGFEFHSTALFLPTAFMLIFLFTLGAALVVSVITVYFRDTQYLLGVFLQLLYFATPILYPLTALPAQYQGWLQLNPLYWQLLIFQKLLYFGVVPTLGEWALAAAISLFSFFFGIWFLSNREEDLVFRL